MDLLDIIIIIAVMVLLPLIPAFLLYRFLPNKASVKGPFKGLNVQFQGAFAGYFITLLMVAGFYMTFMSQMSKYEPWTIEGSIRLAGDSGSTGNLMNTAILVQPPDQYIYPDGRFIIKNILLPAKKGPVKPSLIIQKEGCNAETLFLQEEPTGTKGFKDYRVCYLPGEKIIRIEEPIVLSQKKNNSVYETSNASIALPLEVETKRR